MGTSEDMTSVETEKESPSTQEQTQTNLHFYPDSNSIQAYYGPGGPLSQPYYNPSVTAGHVPHTHVWSPPQSAMPPYGLPYSTVYSQGVVYAHPAVPLVATPVSMISVSMISRSSKDIDQGSTKKLKTLDRHAVPVGEDTAEVDTEGSPHEGSQSVSIDASSDVINGNTGAHQSRRRRSKSMGNLSTEHDCEVHAQASTIPEGEANFTSDKVSKIHVNSENVGRKSAGPQNGQAGLGASLGAAGLPFEVWVKDERQLKRERRKQANRESAKRSRLRKQAEIEELMERYESLKVENLTLQSELNQLTRDSEKVRLENAELTEKLNNAQLGQSKKTTLDQAESKLTQINSVDDIPKINNLDSVTSDDESECVLPGDTDPEAADTD